MLLRILLLLVTNLALSTQQQTSSTPLSPCPNVFAYESTSSEPGRWYGVANLSTDSTLHSLWLNIVLDSKADILGNWIGDVTTSDNIDFKIENTKMKLQPGPATAVRFFVQYNPLNKTPKLQAIRLNGREICNANNPLPAVGRPESDRVSLDRPNKVKPRPDSSVSRPDVSGDRPSSRPESSRPESSRPESTSPEYTRPESSRPEYTRPETSRPESARPDYSRPESSRPESTRPEYTRPESSRPEYTRPESSRPESSKPDYTRPESSRPDYSRPDESVSDTHTDIRPEDRPYTRPVKIRPTTSGSPIYVPTQNPPYEESNANPYSIGGGGQHPSQSVGASDTRTTRRDYRITTLRTTTRAPTPSPYDEEDFVDTDESKPGDGNEYFEGGLVTIVTGNNNNNNHNNYDQNFNNNKGQQHETCGKVIRNAEPNPLVVNGRPTLEGQWPWQIALYQTQTVDNKYICGGTLVSHRHIITAAHCVARKGSNRVVNKNTLTIYLGKHNLRTSVDGVQIRLVGEIHIHPSYNASSFSNDLAILTLREPAQFSDWVQPACLWPDSQSDLSNVIGKKGSVVGWGFDDKGVATEELTLVEMPVVDQETCIRSYSEFFARFTSDHTFCAGYRDGTSVCNGDSGGGMVFNMRDHWYLRGLVSLSVARQNEYRCDPTHYVVFTDLAKFSSWIRQYVN